MYVYADNAATTAMSQVAIDAMVPYFNKIYGNPSSLHSVGQEAKEVLEAAREKVAKCIGCEPREIYFTSGGSEADNQAICSAAFYGAKKGKKHIISTPFEHHAVLHTLEKLQKDGFEVTFLDVKEGHNITAQQVKDAIREDTCLSPPCMPTMRSAPCCPLLRSAQFVRKPVCLSTPTLFRLLATLRSM